MTKAQFLRMNQELKQEFESIFKAGGFDGVIKILSRYHLTKTKATTDAQVLIAVEHIRSSWNRGELTPLCSIGTGRDLWNRYAGVGFGIIPRGTIRIQVQKLSKKQLRGLSSARTAVKNYAVRLRKLGKIKEAEKVEAQLRSGQTRGVPHRRK